MTSTDRQIIAFFLMGAGLSVAAGSILAPVAYPAACWLQPLLTFLSGYASGAALILMIWAGTYEKARRMTHIKTSAAAFEALTRMTVATSAIDQTRIEQDIQRRNDAQIVAAAIRSLEARLAPTAQLKLSPAEFTRMLLEGTRAHGLHWKTIEDLFEMAMRQGMPE